GQRPCDVPHQQAEHMAAPTSLDYIKYLAKTEPSTYGPSRHAAVALHRLLSPAADIASQVRLNWSTSADGIKRLLLFACLSAALDALGRDPKIINSVMRLRTLNVIFDKS
ncbi:MAG: hypothetical protein ACI89J_003338, partial [Hyphomicrobiaceae bacterium]